MFVESEGSGESANFPELAWAFDTLNAIMYCVIMSIKYNENNKQNLS